MYFYYDKTDRDYIYEDNKHTCKILIVLFPANASRELKNTEMYLCIHIRTTTVLIDACTSAEFYLSQTETTLSLADSPHTA
ncbi:unnamed protein product [Spodoptera exigua]|nr:unnamed protein product [Spodoptera exigua]